MHKNAQRDKSSLLIFTTLNIPTVTSHPSLKTVQWSADGQVALVSKNAVIILTPDHGINFDNDSAIKSTPNKDDPALGWFKTMIQHDQAVPMKWPEYSQTWSAVSLGSIDISIISLAISPSGLSSHGGCIFATLSSNMDVNLWTAGKNYLRGEWSKIFEVTPFLLDSVSQTPEEKCTATVVLQAQVVSIEWTPQIDFGFEPAPWLDTSLLIVGTRSGHLTFLRYYKDATLKRVTSLQISEKWITQLSFSKWLLREHGVYEGVLAYGSADGAVGCVKIVQTLILNQEGFAFTPTYTIDVTLVPEVVLVHNPPIPVSVTGVKWIHIPNRDPVLVTSNPGLINIWSPPTPEETPYWTGHRSFRLTVQHTSIDSSPFHPASGITYLPEEDRLVVTLLDGSFHVIQHLSTKPEWASQTIVDAEDGHVSSEALSKASRAIFEKAEKGDVDRGDMIRIDGAMMYDGGATFLWVYESSRPSDFSYKHDAKQSSTLVVAQMYERGDDIPAKLYALLTNVKASLRVSPLHQLRPFFLHLRDPVKIDLLRPQLLRILEPNLLIDYSINIHPPSYEDELTEETRLRFRAGLKTELFGWDELLSLRMRLSLADFSWKMSDTEEKRAECGIVAQNLLNAISHRLLRTIIRYLHSVVRLLTLDDVSFITRMILQSLLQGCPSDLTEEGNQLSVLIQPLIEASTQASGSEDMLRELEEICPACGIHVPLQDITRAVCQNGHTWPRCSVTTFILSTPSVRTCVGCSRKAFLPRLANNSLSEISRGWVMEELLKAVHQCLFCSNGFISIL